MQQPRPQLAAHVTRFMELVLDNFLKETNSKLYCELSYFKTLLKHQPIDIQRIESYVISLADRREEFAVLGGSSVRKRDHSRSREKSIKVTLKPQHDRSKTSATSIGDHTIPHLHHALSQPQTTCHGVGNFSATAPIIDLDNLSHYSNKEPQHKSSLSSTTGKQEGISLTAGGCFQQMKLQKERERERERQKLSVLKQNAQYLANMFSRNSRKLTQNDFFEKTRFKKKTVSESKGSGSGSGLLDNK